MVTKTNLSYLIILIVSFFIYHYLILVPFENKRDENKYQNCINHVHSHFQQLWINECKKINKEDNCGLDPEIVSQLEEWRQKSNAICLVALSWSK